MGALEPLDDLLAKYPEITKDYYEGFQKWCSYKGKVYGLPSEWQGDYIYYRKSILEEAGIDPNKINTWDALLEAAIKLTKEGR